LVEGGQGPRFLFEAGQAFGQGSDPVGEELDGDLPVEARIESAPDDSAAALSDLFEKPVMQ
jgi:hypothetical protein